MVDNTQFVTDLYRTELGRAPDDTGFQYWLDALNSGQMSQSDVARAFNTSPEGVNYDIGSLYQSELGRAPDSTGATYWGEQLSSGAMDLPGLTSAIRASDEYKTLSVDQYKQDLINLFKQEYGREPTDAELAQWAVGLRSKTNTLENLPSALSATPEGTVFDLYKDVLGRTPDAKAKYWVDALTAGTMTPEQVRSSLANSPEKIALDRQAAIDAATAESKKALEAEQARQAAGAAARKQAEEFYQQQMASMQAKAREMASRGPFQATAAPTGVAPTIFDYTYNPARDPFMQGLPTGSESNAYITQREQMAGLPAQAAAPAPAPAAGTAAPTNTAGLAFQPAPAAVQPQAYQSIFAPQFSSAGAAAPSPTPAPAGPVVPVPTDAAGNPIAGTDIFYNPTA